MTKRRSSTSSSSPLNTRLILVGLAIILVLIVIYGVQGALSMIGAALGLDLGPTPIPPAQVNVSVETPGPQTPSAGGAGNAIQVYFTDPTAFTGDETQGGVETHLVDLINGAQSTIDGAMYQFNLQDVADALIAAHNRGVKIRIAYDNEYTEPDPQMKQVIDAGIQAVPDERSAFMHDKFFVIDGQTVWTGSWNVTTNDTFRNNNNALIIRSTQLAQNYTAEIDEMMNGQFGPDSPANTPNPSLTLNGIQIENYFSPEDEPMPHLISLASTAQKTLHFMTFSFTDDDLANAIIQRAQAGVQVAGIFESRGANTEASSCPPLLSAGLDVRLDGNKYTFHHKVLIVDSAVVAVGSFNWSNNAANSNDENLLIIHDPNIAALYEQEFNKQMGISIAPVGGQCLTK